MPHETVDLSDIELTAFHEAGHAVMLHAFNEDIGAASVIPDERTNGRVRSLEDETGRWLSLGEIELVDPDDRPRCAASWVMIGMAGCAAALRRQGSLADSEPNFERGGGHDQMRVIRYLSYVPFEENQSHPYVSLWRCTCRALGERWEAVEALADALLKKRKMDGREVCDLLDRHSTNAVPSIDTGAVR